MRSSCMCVHACACMHVRACMCVHACMQVLEKLEAAHAELGAAEIEGRRKLRTSEDACQELSKQVRGSPLGPGVGRG